MLMWTVYCTLLYTNPSPICIVETLVTEKEIHVNKTVIFVRYIHKQIYIFLFSESYHSSLQLQIFMPSYYFEISMKNY